MGKTFEFKFKGCDREVTLSSFIELSKWMVGFQWHNYDCNDNKNLFISAHILCFSFHVEYWRWAKNES